MMPPTVGEAVGQMHRQRLERALAAAVAYEEKLQSQTPSGMVDDEEVIVDLLTDLLHLAESKGLGAWQMLGRAEIHWSHERDEQLMEEEAAAELAVAAEMEVGGE